jgi:hypothetical protein
MCDSLISSLSCSNLNKLNDSMKEEHKIPIPRFKLKSPTTFSQLKLNKSSSHNDILSSMEQSSTKSKEQSKGKFKMKYDIHKMKDQMISPITKSFFFKKDN